MEEEQDDLSREDYERLEEKYKSLWEQVDGGTFEGLKAMVNAVDLLMKDRLPELEEEVQKIIDTKNTNIKKIETSLDGLLVLTQLSYGDALFGKLLDYYKTINPQKAAEYWDTHENKNFF